ncbi:MAG: thiamine-phosphate kinase [Desulfonatronovibrionaceae bacterium]
MPVSYPGYPGTDSNNKNEQDYLDLIREHFPQNGPGIVLGPGDDCAVVSCPDKICLTTDTLQQDVHFRTSYFPPQAIGHKALAVSLSDLAAMGALPSGFLLSLVLPGPGLKQEFFRGILEGMSGLAAEHKVLLAGGNICSGRDLGLTVTAWGAAGDHFLLRRAAPGDILFVLGEIGLARTGLQVLENAPELTNNYPRSLQGLFYPRPLVKEGRQLAELPFVRGLMDVSDGLAADIPRLLGPGLGAEIDPDLPVHPETSAYAEQAGKNPLKFALAGGEDYALLGAAEPEGARPLAEMFPDCLEIGRVSDTLGLRLGNEDLFETGFDHFKDHGDR